MAIFPFWQKDLSNGNANFIENNHAALAINRHINISLAIDKKPELAIMQAAINSNPDLIIFFMGFSSSRGQILSPHKLDAFALAKIAAVLFFFRVVPMLVHPKIEPEKLNYVGTYNLLFNAALMVEAGAGYALGLEGIINTGENSELCFRPLRPELTSQVDLVWNKNHYFSRPAEIFLAIMRKKIEAGA